MREPLAKHGHSFHTLLYCNFIRDTLTVRARVRAALTRGRQVSRGVDGADGTCLSRSRRRLSPSLILCLSVCPVQPSVLACNVQSRTLAFY